MSEHAVDNARPGGEKEDVPGGESDETVRAAAGAEPGPVRPSSHRRSLLGGIATSIAWILVAGWAGWTLLRLTGADRLTGLGHPLVPLISFTPYVAATVLIPVICALLLRRWAAAIAAGVTAVLLAAAVLPRALPSDDGSARARGPVLRVLTANLMYGEADPEYVVALVRRTRADVLSLQELPPGAVKRLEKAGLSQALPYRHLDLRKGAMGSGMFARHPLTALPAPATRMAMPRALLTLPGGRRVEVDVVHPLPPISRPAVERWRHDLRTLPAAEGGPGVRILAGDFNATFDHAEFRRLLRRGYADAADREGIGLVPTWGVSRGGTPLTIDHVLADRRCAVLRAEVFDLPGSDHRALLAELRLP